jgi:hypothetical protein
MQLKKWLSPAGTKVAAVRHARGGWWRGLSKEDFIPGSLALLAAALTVWIAFELALPAGTQLVEPAATPAGSQERNKPTGDQAKARNYIRDITRRPLFQAVRTKPASRGRTVPAAPPPVSPPVADDFELMGVIGGATPEAIIMDRRSGKTYTVTVGQVIDGMTVKEIAPRSVVLEVGKGSIRIGL